MMIREKRTALSDSETAGVSGGTSVSIQWGDYLSIQVMPILNGLMVSASESDKAVLLSIYGILQSTKALGADIPDTVTNLWMTYNAVYRPSLQSSKIRTTLDQTLYSARQYIASRI